MPLIRHASEIYERQGNKPYLQIILSNLGTVPRETGALREAIGALRQAQVLARELGDRYWEGFSLRELGRVLATMGDRASSRIALRRSQYLFAKQGYPQAKGVAIAYLAERALWLGAFAAAHALAERAWALAGVQQVESDFIRAALLQGRATLGLGDLARAEERLHFALTRARAVNNGGIRAPSPGRHRGARATAGPSQSGQDPTRRGVGGRRARTPSPVPGRCL